MVSFILIGASGTGRTTFVNTLCESDVLQHKEPEPAESVHLETGIRIKPANVGQLSYTLSWNLFMNRPGNIELEEDGIRIALTVVDTPGFGDSVDNEHSSVSPLQIRPIDADIVS